MNSCQSEIEVIAIEDDDEEDVEVVFSNLTKTHVHRNVTYRKISQEIELLQAMCKHPVPNEFSQFKELAKKLGFQDGDGIVQSAWHRIFRKHQVKAISLPNKKTSKICLVELPQSSVAEFPPQIHSSPNCSHSVGIVSPPSTPVPPSSASASLAVPVALIMNKSLYNRQKAELSMNHESSISIPATTQRDDQKWQNKQVVPDENNIYGQMEAKVRDKKEAFSKKNNIQNKKHNMDTVRKEPDKPGVLKSGAENLDNTQFSPGNDLLRKYLDSLIPGQNLSSVSNKVPMPIAKKRKSPSKQVVIPNLPKPLEQASAHVGVQAKIIRVKRTSPRKRCSKAMKEISDAELKEFKAEQKRLKNEEKRQFEMQQLQKVHDRLVDVLIPKYYKKNLNEKG